MVTVADKPTSLVALHAARERVIEALSGHYASGVFEVEELERRIEAAQKAGTLAELDALLADLQPAESEALVPAAPTALARADEVPQSKLVFAAFGGVERKGDWLVPRRLRIWAVMGGAEIDLREARLAPGVNHITAFALMGGVTVLVPPGLRVEVHGSGIMGGFGDELGIPVAPDANAPSVSIGGLALMGGVHIEQRLPGESRRQARKRRRGERKRLPRARARGRLEGDGPDQLGPKSES